MSFLYLFDFDGTLVDSMPSYAGAMLKILDEEGISYPDDIVKIITPLGTVGTAKYYKELGVSGSEEEIIERFGEYAMDAYFYKIPAKENVVETLRFLKEKGASLNILTASPHITLDACLKRIGIFELFDNIWSCDDFGKTKSDPLIYKEAAYKLGVDIKSIRFFDDNINALKTAKEAGMTVFGVYDDSSADYTDEIKEISDYYIHNFKEICEI